MQTLSLAIVAAIFSASLAQAADRRSVVPDNEKVDIVEVEPTTQTAFGFAAQNSEGDFTKLFRDAGDAQISSALEDLNGDGRPEIITVLAGESTCGIRDCEVIILTPDGSTFRTIFDSYASSIALGPPPEAGWRDLITNFIVEEGGKRTGVIWKWNGESYALR
jgi:hypothetical protein